MQNHGLKHHSFGHCNNKTIRLDKYDAFTRHCTDMSWYSLTVQNHGQNTLPFYILFNIILFFIWFVQTSSYLLEIHAVDSGSPQLTGKTLLHVQLLDVNDSPPKCSQSNYTAIIQVYNPYLRYVRYIVLIVLIHTVAGSEVGIVTVMIFRILSPGCPRPSIALQFRFMA